MNDETLIGLGITVAILALILLGALISAARRREREALALITVDADKRFMEIYTTMRMIPESEETDIITRRKEHQHE